MRTLLPSQLFKGLAYACSAKHDGNLSFRRGPLMQVIRNRKKYFKKFGINPNEVVVMSLLHGTRVRYVSGRNCGYGALKPAGIAADCLVTDKKHIFLFLLTGDCLPVTLYDPRNKILALAHISYANAKKSFAAKIIRVLERTYRCQAKQMVIAIGPAIHQHSFLKKFPHLPKARSWHPFLKRLKDGTVAVDLIGYNKNQLIQSGVLPQHIVISKTDTATSKNFFSHERSKTTGEPEGRFATIVGMSN